MLRLLLLLLGALAGFAPARDGPAQAPLADLIADLGHPVYSEREKAQREIWKRGDASAEALERALKNENPEVVRRARELLEKLSWGVRPDSSPEVLQLLRRFQAGDLDPRKSTEVRREAVRGLLKQGQPGLSVVRALLAKNLPAEVKGDLIQHVTTHLRREIPRRLVEGRAEDAADLIALHAAGTGPEGAADYAVFHLLRDNLPAAISSAESALNGGKHPAKLILAHLYRSRGDWEKARAVATELPTPEDGPGAIEFLREDEGDWATLADTLSFSGMNHPDAARLTMLRLAGRTREFDESVRTLIRQARAFDSQDEQFNAAVALFANHRAAEATRILAEGRQNPVLLAEVLIAQLRYEEALALQVNPEATPPDEIAAFNLRRVKALVLTGQSDDAVRLLNDAAAQLRKEIPDLRSASFRFVTAVRSLLRIEMRLNLKDLAAEHAALFVTDSFFQAHERSLSGETAFEILFGPDAVAAESLFQALHRKKIPAAPAGDSMKRVRELLTGKSDPARIDEAIGALPDDREMEMIRGEYRQHNSPLPAWLSKSATCLARAAVCRAASRDADTETALKEAAGLATDAPVAGSRTWVFGDSDAHRPFVEWGDFLFDRGRYRDSAAELFEGWKKFPDQPLLLFLSGKALAKGGDTKEGARRMEMSHCVALGQERIRGKFLDELVRRGEAAAAKREIDLVLRGCWCRDHYFGNVMNQSAEGAVLNRDFTTAEKCRQRSLLVILRTPEVYFVELSAYMNVPHELLVYRARARLAAGKIEEALALAREVQSVTPGHLELVSGMVPELERLGRKAEADELFDRAWAEHRKILIDYPAGNFARHALAALAANCRRELLPGLAYAREAVKAEPHSLPYRETLAELHFLTGDRALALDLMTSLAKENPRNRLYRRQLDRYRSAAFDSPRPERAD